MLEGKREGNVYGFKATETLGGNGEKYVKNQRTIEREKQKKLVKKLKNFFNSHKTKGPKDNSNGNGSGGSNINAQSGNGAVTATLSSSTL